MPQQIHVVHYWAGPEGHNDSRPLKAFGNLADAQSYVASLERSDAIRIKAYRQAHYDMERWQNDNPRPSYPRRPVYDHTKVISDPEAGGLHALSVAKWRRDFREFNASGALSGWKDRYDAELKARVALRESELELLPTTDLTVLEYRPGGYAITPVDLV